MMSSVASEAWGGDIAEWAMCAGAMAAGRVDSG